MKAGEVVGRVVHVPADRSPFVRLDVQDAAPVALCRVCGAAALLSLLAADARRFAHAAGCAVGEAMRQSGKPVEVVDVVGEGH